MVVFANLHEKKPREKSGSRASSRFEFQANFSILKILDLQETGNDYRALFDHFDDLTILNSSSTPTKIEFFQIKGRGNGAWTIKQLTKEEQGNPPRSIIGKMYQNAAAFPVETEHTSFASNSGFKIKLKDGTKTTDDHTKIDGAELHASELQIIDAVLESDFPSPRNPACAGVLVFERTNLPVQQQAVFVTGRLLEHLEKPAGDEHVSVKALYDVLFQNVMARAGNTEEPSSLAQLYANKSLTRADVTGLINRAIEKRQFENVWPAIVAELTSIGCTSITTIRIYTATIRYRHGRATGDRTANEFSAHFQNTASAQKAGLSACARLIDAAELIREHLTKIPYADNELLGALLVEAYEAIDEKK